MAKKSKVTKKMLKKAYKLGNWNSYLYDVVYQEGVNVIQSAFRLNGDDDFDKLQELVDAFVAGFHGDKKSYNSDDEIEVIEDKETGQREITIIKKPNQNSKSIKNSSATNKTLNLKPSG